MYIYSTLIVIGFLHIDMCYSSVSAKSTLVNVMKKSRGERPEGVLFGLWQLLPVILTIDLIPYYVLFLHSYCNYPLHIDISYSSTSAKSTLVKMRKIIGGSRSACLFGWVNRIPPSSSSCFQPGTVSLTPIIISHIAIDICYCSISAKSTLVGLRKKVGPQRREHTASWLDQPSSLAENVFCSQPGTVSLTFVMIIRIVIDICFSSINAKSTLVKVKKIIEPDRRESSCLLAGSTVVPAHCFSNQVQFH